MKQALLVIIAGILLSHCSPQKDEKTELNVPSHPVKEIVMEGFNHPWSMAFMNENNALITEKDGNFIKVNLERKERTVIKGFPSDLADSLRVVYGGDNSGIFDVLIDPNFDINHFVYVSYAAKKQGIGTATKVIRAEMRNDSLVNLKTILEAGPYTREYFHYGGGMTFGADGKLYLTMGERLFKEKDEPEVPIAQDLRDKRGKIYRINSDGTIPDDNPDFSTEAVPGVYALGIRAAQGITLNKKTGHLWFSEHGTIQGDEINLLESGANYGWPVKTTGKLRSADYTPPQVEGTVYTDPKWFWPHTVAPTGLLFYSGDEFLNWKGDLLVPGLSRGNFWRFRLKNNEIVSAEELFVNDRVRSRKLIQSPSGKLYMLTDEDNGKVVRIKNTLE